MTGLWFRMARAVKGRERRYADAAAVLVLLLLTTVAAWGLLRGGTVVGMDAAVQYYPWYSFMGESLRSFDIPGWNPHQLSGTPFAADPLSGWAYLPAMVLFTLLPLEPAAGAYLSVHLLLAGLFTYALARALGMNVAGALLAAVAYGFSSFLYVQNTCCFGYAGVMSWLPLAILGAEMAIRSPRWLGRGLWWGVSGLGLSQILASWLGQGSYYALLALGGYVAYRTLLSPPENVRGVRGRLVGSVLHGGAILLFGFGLAAAGVLPRLEYNGLSNLAGGYPGSEAGARAEPVGGASLWDWGLLLEPSSWYVGGAVLVLALVAPLVARGRSAAPYFAALSLCALILTVQGPTPLHSALYLLLPRFEQLHPHIPERVMVVFFLGIALLAGATLSRLGELGKKARFLLFLPVLAVILPITAVASIPRALLLALIFSVVLLASPVRLPTRLAALRRLAPMLLILVVFADLLASGRATIAAHRDAEGDGGVANKIRKVDLTDYYRPAGAARFLRSQGEEGTFRYLGYGPRYGVNKPLSSPYRFTDPRVRALEVNNRAMPLGLQSIQGYNALHIARYGEYLRALNERGQGYHYADVFEGGLDSPLLDLLNTRYIIVPSEVSSEEGDEGEAVQRLVDTHPTVYEDDRVKVLENREALPRAWIVHRAQRVEPGEALALLSSNAVDPEETALLEKKPPNLGFPGDTSADRASVEEYEADRMELHVSTKTPGMLVLGEVYYPAWKAYVDGEPVPLYRADHLFRAVPVPAGEHTVELRYESWTLRLGTAISLLTGLVLAALLVARMRPPRGGAKPTPTADAP